VGCGWGVAGVYCAKLHRAAVTSVDVDDSVFPFLRLHSDVNHVQIVTQNDRFEDLTSEQLSQFDVMIGADICFWDDMVSPLERLIQNALSAGVRLILLADPGRQPFDRLEKYFVAHHGGQAFERRILQPFPVEGRLLKIGSLDTPA
jgi:predicted nicotinamide N-methyase